MMAEICTGIITGLVTEGGKGIVKKLWVPVKSHVGYLVSYKKKVAELQTSWTKLQQARNDDVQRCVDAARWRGEEILESVNQWLKEVDRLGNDVISIRVRAAVQELVKDWSSRYKLGKKAAKMKLLVADKLLAEKDSFSTTGTSVSKPQPPTGYMPRPMGDFEAFDATNEVMKKVMDAMEDRSKPPLIGIYGMGGVGKTTLMKEIGRQLKVKNRFNAVVMAVVSQTPDVRKIQRDIADQLGLKITQLESEDAVSIKLSSRLKEEKNILIMLDDLWKRLDLQRVGIPYGGDEHEHKGGGCKILFTTRKHDVCRAMESHAIPVNVLSGKDSWSLFKSKAKQIVDYPELEEVATEVARHCGGLPLALVTVGLALSGCTHINQWEYARDQLRRPSSTPTDLEGVEEDLFNSIKLSYTRLRGDTLKSLFLFCCLFPEDYQIGEDELTRCLMGEDFLTELDSLKDKRDRVSFLVAKLIDSCLLLTGDHKKGYVKMHDVVRVVAIHIASSEDSSNYGFLVVHNAAAAGGAAGGQAGSSTTKWPKREKLEKCKRLSLMDSDICIQLPDQPKCNQLQTLILSGNPKLRDIPEDFFMEMKALTVLDLSGSGICSLPCSLSCLTNLKTLCLDNCWRLKGGISVVGQLERLEVLSLRDFRCELLLEKLGRLINLKLLDLSDSSGMLVPWSIHRYGWILPANVIKKLPHLEELYVNGWTITKAVFAEIAALKCLAVLHIEFNGFYQDNAVSIGAWENLRGFAFHTGIATIGQEVSPLDYPTSLQIDEVWHIADWVKVMLLRKAQYLSLMRCKDSGLKNLGNLDQVSGFGNLKILALHECHFIKCLLSSTTTTDGVVLPPKAFCDLEELSISCMENMSRICQGPISDLSFGKLRKVNINNCGELVNIFPWDLLQRVQHSLETLELWVCDKIQNVFHFEWHKEGHPILPKMHSVKVWMLSNLTSCIWTGVVPPPGSLQNLTNLSVHECPKLAHVFPPTKLDPRTFTNLQNLDVSYCGGLKYLFLPSLAHELRSLETLRVSGNNAMEEIIAGENQDGLVLDKGVFPKLKQLELERLPNLGSFYQGRGAGAPISFYWPSLEYVKLSGCRNLRRLPIRPESAPKLKEVGVDDEEWFKGLEWEDPSIPSCFPIIRI